jgi:hypothetical protein
MLLDSCLRGNDECGFPLPAQVADKLRGNDGRITAIRQKVGDSVAGYGSAREER